MKRGKHRVKYIRVCDHDKYNLSDYPNFDAKGNITGMKNLYYGLDSLLVKCSKYIYNVTSNPEIYNAAH